MKEITSETYRSKRLYRKRRAKRRRTIKRLSLLGILAILFLIGIGIFIKVTMPYETIDLSKLVVANYSGYNTKGSAHVSLKQEEIQKTLKTAFSDYSDDLFVIEKKLSSADYQSIVSSIQCKADKAENLSNDEEVKLTFSYNEELAKKLKVRIYPKEAVFAVSQLPEATVLSVDDVFRDVSISVNGISPYVTISVSNNSADGFIHQMVLTKEPEKEYYENGDKVRIVASYSESDALSMNYTLDVAKDECYQEIIIADTDEYVVNSTQLSGDVLQKAIEHGKTLFTDANTYGVRIFCEAKLVPVYINKKATFEWVNPSILSAYLKCVKPDAAGQITTHYNNLDCIYLVKLTQADGVTCDAEAIVRYTNLVIHSDGTCDIDLDSGKLISASFNNSSIKENVVESEAEDYNIEKLDISGYR